MHRDFCAENFVVDGDDVLRVIDNEWFCPGPAGFDVGRTRNRWSMTEAETDAFDAGYRDRLGPIVSEAFWGLAADLFGARVEDIWVLGPERPILERVRCRAAGGSP
jgi:thiamine kinase-like enzyme